MEQTNLINSTTRKKITSIQNTVSAELQSENNIAKIICAKADSIINSYEALAGELRYSGSVCFSVTYSNELGEFFNLKTTESFTGKIENELITVNFVPMFSSDEIELKVSSTNDEVKLSAVIETCIEGVVTESVNYYINNNEDIITNSNFVTFNTLNSSGKLNFNYEESFNSKEKINKILFASANVCINNYSLGTDYFTVEGIITVNIGYEIGEETKELRHFTNTYKFKEELEKEGITKEGLLILKSNVFDCEIQANLSETEDESIVNLVLPVEVNYVYLIPITSEIVVDAYSLKNKLNLNIESFKILKQNLEKTFQEKVDGQYIINDEAPRIIKIVSYCDENASITNIYKDADKLIVEGIASVNVVYLEDDDTERLNSVIIEVPYQIEERCDDILEDDEICASVIVKDVEAKCKKGKEINIDMELCFQVSAFSSIEEMALTNVVIGEPLNPKEACLQIYFARKGSTLWDISKGLVTKPEKIIEQNPNLNLPLVNDEKIVLFKNNQNN